MAKIYPARILVISFAIVIFAGCDDRYSEGYSSGYNDGYAAAEDEYKSKLSECENKKSRSTSSSYYPYGYQPSSSSQVQSSYQPPKYMVTEVCGGGGVTVNGKEYRPGKKGCVRVYSDGTSERY